MTPQFSICVPTRGRQLGLTRLAKSIDSMSDNPELVELILRIDDDDHVASQAANDLVGRIRCPIILVVLPHNEFLSDLWEDCYPSTHADRIMMCADDCVFRTKGWDTRIAAVSPDSGRKVYFLYGNDLYQKGQLAAFPILSRAWIECVGFFVPRGYHRDWCDTHIHDIANRLKSEQGILKGTIVTYFKDIIFEHLHPAAGKAKYDKTYTARLKMPCEARQYHKRGAERSAAALKLARYIKKGVVPPGAKL